MSPTGYQYRSEPCSHLMRNSNLSDRPHVLFLLGIVLAELALGMALAFQWDAGRRTYFVLHDEQILKLPYILQLARATTSMTYADAIAFCLRFDGTNIDRTLRVKDMELCVHHVLESLRKHHVTNVVHLHKQQSRRGHKSLEVALALIDLLRKRNKIDRIRGLIASLSMASRNTSYIVKEKGGALLEITAAKPTITKPSEIMIRLKTIAINPADCKMIDQGHRVTSWPLVPGLDGAGVVDAVGEGVKNFALGDEVLAMFTAGDRGASYQSFAVVQENMVAMKPRTWSFEEAASLGVCYLTGLMALGIGLKTALPFLKHGPTSGFKPSSVLVLGGSSAVGAATIQLLRLAVPDCLILATSSPKHHSLITNTLGADGAFDRSSASLIEEVMSASHGSRGIDAIIDTVGAGRTQRHVFELFDPDGPKRYAQVWTGDEEITVPDGVESVMFRGQDVSRLQGGQNIMLALQTLLEKGKYKLPLPVHKVGDGFEGLVKGLDLMRKGVSGEKLVVAL